MKKGLLILDATGVFVPLLNQFLSFFDDYRVIIDGNGLFSESM